MPTNPFFGMPALDRDLDLIDIDFSAPPTRNAEALHWIAEMTRLCAPRQVRWCDGSESERACLTALALEQGVLESLDQARLPGCYLHRSHPGDVARSEERTFICTPTREEAGPTNHWVEDREMYARLLRLAAGGMAGRTMYVVPYLMGHPGSPHARVGIELTDSLHAVLAMRIMTRMGQAAWHELGEHGRFSRGLHVTLGCDPERRHIAHFPHQDTVIALGSDYGGNALLGKKCLALRLASWQGRREGWLAEHMLIMGIESPQGEKTYIAAAFPSGCGKTDLAMLAPPPRFAGWKVWTVGDDIAWMHVGEDGRLYAINPEHGYFGAISGTSARTNPNAIAAIAHDTIYANVARTPDGGVWWEGKDGPVPEACTDWRGRPWTPRSGEPAAHPNARFAAPLANNPALAPETEDPRGVPISAILFGGRRPTTCPLVMEALSWTHGVYLGATLRSATTAAADGAQGVVRADPMAMLPFCGYHLGDYLGHWLAIGRCLRHPPRIFQVNWFREDGRGSLLWPGFGENLRVLSWIVDRCHGRAAAEETPLGLMPPAGAIDLDGLPGCTPARLAQAQAIVPAEWARELELQQELYDLLDGRMPADLVEERRLLRGRLGA